MSQDAHGPVLWQHCARCRCALGWQSLMLGRSELHSSILGCLIMAREWNWHWRAWFLNPVTPQIPQWELSRVYLKQNLFAFDEKPAADVLEQIFNETQVFPRFAWISVFQGDTFAMWLLLSLPTFPWTSLSTVGPQCFKINWYEIPKICLCFSQGTNWLEERN